MPKSYRHLAYEERCQVENPKKSGLSKGSIAQHPTLISDQITPLLGSGPIVALRTGNGIKSRAG